MKQNISSGVAIAIIVVAVIVAVVIGYKLLGSPRRDVSPQDQMKMMQNMKRSG